MSNKPYLLVVEDDPGLLEQLTWSFDNFTVVTATNRAEAIAQLRRHEPAVVTLDLGLPPSPDDHKVGMATLQEIFNLAPATKVIMVTGQDDRKVAIEAIGLGAYDFYTKPIDISVLSMIVDRAYYLHTLEKDHRSFWQMTTQNRVKGIITSSPKMLKVCKTIEKVGATDITTLLLGESGTGKEILARALHYLSARKNEPFVAINCAAIPENLLETELFGHEKGAFTGAIKQTPGKIEMSSGGTLFLDEVGDLPFSLQPKLLRFLQERVVERIGGRTEIPIDVRVILATHQPLLELIKANQFREDLYYRISEMVIDIPPLRDRGSDTILLARMFLNKFSQEFKRPLKGFAQDALEAIANYSWPGNVREMENRIKRSVIMTEKFHVGVDDLELPLSKTNPVPFSLKSVREEAEREAIIRALNYVNGNLSKAAELLGLTRPTLYNLLDKLEIREKAVHQD